MSTLILEYEELKWQCRDLFKQGWFRVSNSSYVAPIVMVRISDGSIRAFVDYKTLNDCTVVNAQLHKHTQGNVTQTSVQCWAIWQSIKHGTLGFWWQPFNPIDNHPQSYGWFAIQPPVAEFFTVATYLSAASSSPLCTPSSVPPLAQCTVAYWYESTNTASRYYEPCTATPCAAIKMDAQQFPVRFLNKEQ